MIRNFGARVGAGSQCHSVFMRFMRFMPLISSSCGLFCESRANYRAVKRLPIPPQYLSETYGSPHIPKRKQRMIAQIEEDERQRMESHTERRTMERRQEIRDHRPFLKQDGRFHGILRTVRSLPDRPEWTEAFRRFWAELHTAVYEDPFAPMRGEALTLRTAALGE
jgi:hypothetical protein